MPPKNKGKNEQVDVNKKVDELTEEVFTKYNSLNEQLTEQGNPYVNKEQMREFLRDIFSQQGEGEAWNNDEFNKCYEEFDQDGDGFVEKAEFTAFIKRYADL